MLLILVQLLRLLRFIVTRRFIDKNKNKRLYIYIMSYLVHSKISSYVISFTYIHNMLRPCIDTLKNESLFTF